MKRIKNQLLQRIMALLLSVVIMVLSYQAHGRGSRFLRFRQKTYTGTVQQTLSGMTCQKWTAQSPHGHSRTPQNYPNTGLGDHNYCRNPDNMPGGAWCYTANPLQRWDYCDVPTLCQKWTSQSPHKHSRTPENYPDTGLGDHNNCRNPDNGPEGAWCYTTDPDLRWEHRNVPKC